MLKYDISFFYKKVTELLDQYDKPYKIGSNDPSVDIWKIAQDGFGVKIKFISSWPYKQKHAYIENKKGVDYIFLNEKDKNNDARCRFSIAHELGHLVLGHIPVQRNLAYRALRYYIGYEWLPLFSSVPVKDPQITDNQSKYLYNSFIKQSRDSFYIPDTEFPYLLTPAPVKTGKKSKILNYNIAHEWGRIVYNNYYVKDLTTKANPDAARHISSNPVSKLFRSLFIKGWGREELADHFAANLLVPIYRFQHYLDKPNKELACNFKVDEKCIIKRRNELKREMNALTAAVKPLSIEEIVDPNVEYCGDTFLKDVTNR